MRGACPPFWGERTDIAREPRRRTQAGTITSVDVPASPEPMPASAGLDEHPARNRHRHRVPFQVASMTAMTTKNALSGDVCLLTIEGEVDCANADELCALVLRAFEDAAVQAVAVDLAGVSFCDAAALGALVRMRNAALDRDKSLTLRSVSTAVARLLGLTGLDAAFTIAPTYG